MQLWLLIIIPVLLLLLKKQRRYRPLKSDIERHFDELYRNVDGFALSQQARVQSGDSRAVLTYGEITFPTLHALLEFVQPTPHSRFYDCGAGVGKAVIGSALLYSLQAAVGIECLPTLCAAAREVATRYTGTTPVTFIEGDLFTVDWRDADIVFINATCFFGEDWQRLIHLCQQLRPGSRLIITSKSLPETHFRRLDQRLREMSWGWATVTVYERLPLQSFF